MEPCLPHSFWVFSDFKVATMNVLLINLTRFGDLLQSQAAISHLRGEPGSGNAVAMICLANFAQAASLLRGVDRVFPLPRDGFLQELGEQWAPNLGRLWKWRQSILAEGTPDLLCNLTANVSSRVLGDFLGQSCRKSGFSITSEGFGQTAGWGVYTQLSSRYRNQCCFNIVDLFRAVAGASKGSAGDAGLAQPSESLVREMRSQLLDMAQRMAVPADKIKGFTGLQLGASARKRQWPVESFAAVGDALLQLGYMPVLLGNEAEAPLAEAYAARASEIAHKPGCTHLSLAGKTNLQQLGATLRTCSLLVSNDTGTLHLAAGLDVPVLGIFLATAQPWDTGPYREGSLSLEPDLPCHPCSFDKPCPHGFACHRAITPEAVLHAAVELLNGKQGATFAGDGSRLWESRLDEQNWMDLVARSGQDGTPRTVWLRTLRLFMRHFIDKKELPDTLDGLPALLPESTKRTLRAALAGLKPLFLLLQEQGRVLSLHPLPRFKDGFLRTGLEIGAVLDNAPGLQCLGAMWRQELLGQGALHDAIVCSARYGALCALLEHELV